MVASIEFGAPLVRSGHLLCALLSNETLALAAQAASREFEKISPEVAAQGAARPDGRHGRVARRSGRGAGRGRRPAGVPRGPLGPTKTPVARPVHHRPDGPRPPRRHRPRAGPRRRNPPDHRHPHPPPPEQPDPDRRGGRGQDGRGRGLRPADRRRRRAAAAAERRAPHARPGPAAGRGRHQGRVREPAEVGHRGSEGLAPADHPLHRRGPHDDRRRRAGRPRRRGQPAQAGPGPRRAAHHRRHHLGRIQEVLRERRRPGPPLPGRQGRRAHGSRRRRDDARPGRDAGKAPQGADPRRGRGRRRAALAPLHLRPAAARQVGQPARYGLRPGGDRPHGRAAGRWRIAAAASSS